MGFMGFTDREIFSLLHGMGMGALLLVVFPVVLGGLWFLRPEWVTGEVVKRYLAFLKIGAWIVSISAWLTVIIGSYVPYPWYRANPPAGAGPLIGLDTSNYPRSYLLADPHLAFWHNFGMEWKEHLGWIVPILTTTVAFLVTYYSIRLMDEPKVRKAAIVLFTIAFIAAAISGFLGALITKLAPVR